MTMTWKAASDTAPSQPAITAANENEPLSNASWSDTGIDVRNTMRICSPVTPARSTKPSR